MKIKEWFVRWINYQCGLFGSYSSEWNDLMNNIKEYGLLGPLKCYYYNANWYYWLHKSTDGYDRRTTFGHVILRVFGIKIFIKRNTILYPLGLNEIILHYLGIKKQNIEHIRIL